ncbi:hypothetical protein J3A83DRAFT_4097945 [Scleroderma citrinum]
MNTPNNGQLPAAPRIFYIPELLHLIFGFLNKAHNVSNACVCKLWSEIALDTIWRDVDNMIHLFTILKPIRRARDTYGGDYVFVATPDVTDWTRFQKYARRVRSLSVTFRSSTIRAHVGLLLDEVARTRISLEILPNLHTLKWIEGDMKLCLLFLHSGLKHLTVSCFRDQGTLLADMCARAPNLHTLILHIPNNENVDITNYVQVIARNLHHLKKLVLPEFYYTSSVIQELSHMKDLRVIEFDHDLSVGNGNPMNVESFNPVLTEGSFPALWDLSLTARIDDVDRFFKEKFAPTKITTLYLNSYKKHAPSQVHSLLLTLSQQCHFLSRLHIILLEKEFTHSELPSDEQLSFATLQPLFAFPHLTWFELLHKYPLRITLDEVEELASWWPSLESLDLNSEPLYTHEFTLDLRALLPFAKHCQKLEHLGIFMNTSGFEMPPVRSLIKPFRALRTLNVGTSKLEHPGAVSAFLSLLFPPWCKLQYGVTWTSCGTAEYRRLNPAIEAEILERVDPWEEMSALLPLLIEVRRDERERMQALQEEVEELRIQNCLLMDKAGMRADDSCVVA